MARTIHGNLTGAAAATELADQRAWLFELAKREVAQASAHNRQQFEDLQFEMQEVMGLYEFSKWYDDDDNIPQQINFSDASSMAPIFERMNDAIKKARRPAASERPASNEPGPEGDTASTTDPTDCIIEGEGK